MQINLSLLIVQVNLFIIGFSRKSVLFGNDLSLGNEYKNKFLKLTSRHLIQYPRKFVFRPDDLTDRCQALEPNEENRDLKNQEYFFIKKQNEDEDGLYFVVIMEATQRVNPLRAIGNLYSIKKGHCNDVAVLPKYRGCGLAKYLMQACFEEDATENFATNQIARRGREFNELCEKVKFLECAPTNPNNKIACSGYMSGAILAGFQIIGTTHKNSFNVYAFHIDHARRMMKGEVYGMNAQTFIDQYGEIWYFCKCRQAKLQECQEIIHAIDHRCEELEFEIYE